MSSGQSQQRRNVELVREGVDAFRRGELDGLLALAREDFEIYLPPNLPNAGRYVGRDGFVVWLNQWLEAWKEFTVEIIDATPVGTGHVVAVIHQSGRGKGSGVAVEMDVAYLWEVQEEELVAMQLYATREEALEVAEQRERATGD